MPENPPSLRERRAQLTRDAILRAARWLFAERGYARTSVRDIAQASAQTVYDSVGSKQALVSRLNDLIDTEAGIAAVGRAAAESDDPWEVAATSARITRSILEHCGDIIHALVTGAAAEPELAAALAEGHRRHLEGTGRVVGLLRMLYALGPAVDPDDAVETLAARRRRLPLLPRTGEASSFDAELRPVVSNASRVTWPDAPKCRPSSVTTIRASSRSVAEYRGTAPTGRTARAWLGGGESLGGGDPGGTYGGVEAGRCANDQGCRDAPCHDPGGHHGRPVLQCRVHRCHCRSEQDPCAAAEDGQQEGFGEELDADVFSGGAQ
jgi:AcrR family transcriptional regulator